VTGRRIAKASFYLDGKLVRTVSRPDSQGRFKITVRPRKLKIGIHRLVVRISYLSGTNPGTRTFRRTFAHCARALKPEFTG
jgi:hypothetical protein